MITVPLFPLGSLLVPGQVLNLNIFEERYLRLVSDLAAMPEPTREFGVVAITAGHEVGDQAAVGLASVGTIAHVRRIVRTPSVVMISAVGRRRFRLGARSIGPGGYDLAEVELLPDSRTPADAADRAAVALAHRATALLQQLLELLGRPVPTLPESPDALSFAILLAVPFDPAEQHRLLAIDDTRARLRAELASMRREQHLISGLRAVPRSGPTTIPPAS